MLSFWNGLETVLRRARDGVNATEARDGGEERHGECDYSGDGFWRQAMGDGRTHSIDKRRRVGEAIKRCDLLCKLRLVVALVVRAARRPCALLVARSTSPFDLRIF